jgi:uncharacterized membrane protein YcaP (DUF421 family)
MQTATDLLNLNPTSLGLIVLRTVVVYLVILVALRLAGKRELGQMTPFDLVVLLVLANAVQNAMVGPDTSLNGGILAALTLLILNRAVDRLGLRSRRAEVTLQGHPTLLVHDGHFIEENLQAEGVAEEEVRQALREHGIDDLGTVKLAVLEVDGTISVIPAGGPSIRTRRRVRAHKPAG